MMTILRRYGFNRAGLLCVAVVTGLMPGAVSADPAPKKGAAETPVKAAPKVWKAQKIDALSLSLPGDPTAVSEEIPEAVKAGLNAMKQISYKSDACEINIVMVDAKAEPAQRGAFDGGVNAIKAMADEFAMKEAPLKVSGKEGIEGLINFSKKGEKAEVDMMVLVSGTKMYQIQIFGKPGTTRADAEKVRKSLKLD